MRTYCAKHNKLDADELKVRKIVQHYVLIAANSGLRVGEQRQLHWNDVQLEKHKINGSEQTLARINVARKQVKYVQAGLSSVEMGSILSDYVK